MVSARRGVWVFLLIASAFGCASSGVPKFIGSNDLPSLAGTWTGWVNGPSGGAIQATATLQSNGDYAVMGGAFSTKGKVVVKDGNLLLTSTSGTGALAAGERTSSATLSERSDGALVLTGFGHAVAGPFNFVLVRPK